MSGGVLVAGAPGATVGANQNQGAVYVFTEPAGGWSTGTESAKLVASDGQAGDLFGGLVAISGDTVVVSGDARGSALYVFTRPPGGWSGTVHETARLTLTDLPAGRPSSVAISGGTIAAGGDGALSAYVFTEPAGGWSGTIHQSASLTPSDQSGPCPHGLGPVAIDRRIIVAPGRYSNLGCGPGPAYVFTEPASGWSGTIQESAKLVAPSATSLSSVAVFGSTVVASRAGGGPVSPPYGPVVFNEPASGWSGTIQPSARLTVSATPISYDYSEVVAGSGNEIAALLVPQSDMCGVVYSCDDALYGFSRPLGGWSGTINGASATVHVPDLTDGPGVGGPSNAIAIAGRTIASAGLGAISLLTITPGPPSIRNASLSGLAVGRPKLRFALDAGQNAPPIRSFKLTLPPGLRFANHLGGRTPSIGLNVPPRVVRLRRTTLSMTLQHPAESLSGRIGPPMMMEQNSLITQMRRLRSYNRTHRRKRALTTRIRCVMTDATGHSTPLALTTRIS